MRRKRGDLRFIGVDVEPVEAGFLDFDLAQCVVVTPCMHIDRMKLEHLR